MVFTNLWGLLALLAIPAIIGLHFFRERRRVQRIGGLHLWDFARVTLPVGRRLERFRRSIPLLFQILAAVVLTLLLAGFDIPRTASTVHYTLILDDSLSMSARPPAGSPADRVRTFLTNWTTPNHRYTVVRAGVQPAVLAGPLATRDDVLAALQPWSPDAPAADMEAAVNLAGRFLTEGARPLYLTDRVTTEATAADVVVTGAFGEAAPNYGIAFADRATVEPGRDRVTVTLASYDAQAATRRLRLLANDEEILARDVELAGGSAVTLTLDAAIEDRDLTLRLDDDALAVDNEAILLPPRRRPVRIHLGDFRAAQNSFIRAIEAVPNALLVPSATSADLLIVPGGVAVPASSARRILHFTDTDVPDTAMRAAEGSDLIPLPGHPLIDDVPLEGVLWSYLAATTAPASRIVLATEQSPLYYIDSPQGGVTTLRLNLDPDRSNIFRTPAWPTLIQALIEDTRTILPGTPRSNYRLGEPVPLNLDAAELALPLQLRRDGRLSATYDDTPALLSTLSTGTYELVDATGTPHVRFRVNAFAGTESDLLGAETVQPDLEALLHSDVRERIRNPLLFLALMIAMLGATGLSWAFHDYSS